MSSMNQQIGQYGSYIDGRQLDSRKQSYSLFYMFLAYMCVVINYITSNVCRLTQFEICDTISYSRFELINKRSIVRLKLFYVIKI